MLYFLQPILLWTAAGIIIPIIVHLWNIQQGKTLQVGSIVFITANATTRATSFKLSRLLLLLLRCLLIILLAMLLAHPFYNKDLNEKQEGWIVVAKSGLKEAYHTYKPTIDSLRRQGYILHYFDETFTEADLKDTLATATDTAKNDNVSYWALLKALDEKIPANLPVYLFTDNQLQHFSGSRSAVSLHVKWHTYSISDTTVWLSNAYATATDSIRAVAGKSSASGTYYTFQNLSLHDESSNYKIVEKEGKLWVESNGALHQIITADTTTLSFIIYTTKYVADAKYIIAALDAIKDFTQRKMQIAVVNNIANIPDNFNWLFWLSDDTLPPSAMKNNVLVYEKGKAENIHSTLLTKDESALTSALPVTLYRYIQSPSSFQPVWKNSYGAPVLSVQKKAVLNKQKTAVIYHFYSRFNPQWNDLVWSSSFPPILYHLLFEEQDSNSIANDKRIVDSLQIQPVMLTAKQENNKDIQQNKKDLSQLFWLIAFCLFTVERFVSFRQTKVLYE